MSEAKARIRERIRKLLSMTQENGATEAEAEAAVAMAARLMDEHDLTPDDVGEAGTPVYGKDVIDSGEGLRLPPELDGIAVILGQFFRVRVMGCQCLESKGKGWPAVPAWKVEAFGLPANIEAARFVYRFLKTTYLGLWERLRMRTKLRKSKQSAYYYGLTIGLYRRLQRERAEAARRPGRDASAPGNALVLADEALDRAFEDAHPDVPKARAKTGRDRSVQFAGALDGAGINIARPLGAGRLAIEAKAT